MTTSFLSPTFIIGELRIGSVEGASCINLGNNYPTAFQSHKKHNQGFGNVEGNQNKLSGTKAILDDADVLDMWNDRSESVPGWIRDAVEKRMKSTVDRS